jgi:transposase-like protein
VSIAAVAMANGINANLARRWVLDVERRGDVGSPDQVGRNAVPDLVATAESWITCHRRKLQIAPRRYGSA